MDKALQFNGKKYISTKNAAKITGYTSDYVGQLCRAKKINSRLVGRSWYVLEKDLLDHKKNYELGSTDSKNKLSSKNKKLEKKSEDSFPKYSKKAAEENVHQAPSVVFGGTKAHLPVSQIVMQSRLADIDKKNVLYSKDDKELFPNLVKTIDLDSLKYIASDSLSKALKRPKTKTGFDAFATKVLVITLIFFAVAGVCFNRENISKLSSFDVGKKATNEIAQLFGPYGEKINQDYKKLSEKTLNINNNPNKLAAAVLSGSTWQKVTDWVKDASYKIVRPWFLENTSSENVIVINKSTENTNQTNSKPPAQSVISYVAGSDRAYVDLKMAELKDWILFSSEIPYVSRDLLSRQLDVIVGRRGSSSSSDSSGGGGGGSIDLSNLSALSPIVYDSGTGQFNFDFSIDNVWTGVNEFASLTLTGQTGCLEADGAGIITSSGLPCGSGGGSGGGTWATTTSSVAGRLINYPNNVTDIVAIGSNATTSAEYYFDPSTQSAQIGRSMTASTTILGNLFFPYSSSTIYSSFLTASTTNLIVNGQSFNNFLGSGLSNSGGSLTVSGLTTSNFTSTNISQFTNDAGYLSSTFTFPFDANTGYVSTTTALGLLDGFFSTASSTISGPFRLSALSDGGLTVYNGLVSSGATTTAGTGLTYSANSFNVNTAQNIARLSNLTSDGFVKTSGGDGTLSVDTTTYESALTAGDHLTRTGNDFDVDDDFLLNTGDTYTGLLSGEYSSSTIYSSFNIASTTFLRVGLADGCLNITSGLVGSTGSACGSGGGSSASSTLLSDSNTFSGTNNFTSKLGLASSSPWGQLSINPNALGSGVPEFVIGSSTATHFIVDGSGNVGIGTANPVAKLSFDATSADNTSGIGFGTDMRLYRNTNNSISVEGVTGNAFLGLTAVSGNTAGFTLNAGNFASGGASIFNYSGTGLYIKDYNNNLNVMTLLGDNSGKVGIASTSPFAKFSINPVAGDSVSFVIGSSTGTQLSVSSLGFGTTTVSGLNIAGQATTTSNVGLNITGGCYAINGTCLSTSGGGGGSGDVTAVGSMLSGDAFADATADDDWLGLGASAGRIEFDDQTIDEVNILTARMGIATSTPNATLALQGSAGFDIFTIASSTGANVFSISEWGGITQRVSSSTALSIQMASGTPVFEVDTTSSDTNAGIDITAATGQTANLLNIFNPSGSFLSGFSALGGLMMNISSTSAFNIYDSSTNPAFVLNTSANRAGFGTSSPQWALTISTSTAPQLALAAGAGVNQWVFRNAGGNLYLATSSHATYATTSIAALEIAGDGFGTTTVRGLNIAGQATTTSNVGLNITGGCYAINGTCLSTSGGGGGSSASSTLLADSNTFSGTNNFTGSTGYSSSTPFARLSVNAGAGEHAFVVGSSTATSFIVDKNGNVGIGTANPVAKLSFDGTSIANTSGIAFADDLKMYRSGTNTLTLQGSGNTIFTITTGASGGSLAALDFNGQTLGSNLIRQQSGTALYIQGNNATGITVLNSGNAEVGIGTTTPLYMLNPFSSSAPQLALSAGAGFAQTAFRNDGTTFSISTTTVAGTATTSVNALEIALGGFGTTTVRGLNIAGQATTTSNVGLNITGGCYAINGTCLSTSGGGGGSSASSTLLGDFNTFTNTNNFTGKLGLASSSPWGQLSINSNALGSGVPEFVIGSSTATHFIVTGAGNVGIGVSNPTDKFEVGTGSNQGFRVTDTGAVSIYSEEGLSISDTDANNLMDVSGNSQDNDILIILGTGTRFVLDKSDTKFTFVGGEVGIGTTTPSYMLNPFSSSASQLALSAGAGISQWAFRNAGGNLYLSTTTVAGTATTSIAALEISGSGFGTTTVRGLNIAAQATTTSNVGLNITGGCYAINGTCLSTSGGGGGSSASSTLLSDSNTFSGTTNFNSMIRATGLGTPPSTGAGVEIMYDSGIGYINSYSRSGGIATPLQINNSLTILANGNTGIGFTNPTQKFAVNGDTYLSGSTGIASTTPWARLSVDTGSLAAGVPSFVVGSSTRTDLVVTQAGNVGIGTAEPTQTLTVNGSFGAIGASNSAFTFNPVTEELSLSAGLGNLPSFNLGSNGTMFSQFTFNSRDFAYKNDTGGNGFSNVFSILNNTSATNGSFGIGTTTPFATLAVQGQSGNTEDIFQVASSSFEKYLSVSSQGFGTTTLSGLNISGSATSTSNVGFNLTSGCYAMNGTCLSGNSVVSNASTTLLADSNTFSGTNNFTGSTGYSTSSPFARLSVDTTSLAAGVPSFVVGSSTRTDLVVTQAGNVGIGTAEPTVALDVVGTIIASQSVGVGNGESFRWNQSSEYFFKPRDSNTLNSVWSSAAGATVMIDAANDSTTDFFRVMRNNSQEGSGTEIFRIQEDGSVGIGTTTPFAKLSINPIAGDSVSFVIGSSTGTQLSVSSLGFGTTTLSGLNISGSATSTSNVGMNITSGCYAINGTCLSTSGGGGGGSSASSTLLGDFNTFTNTNNFTGKLGLASSSPWGQLSINSNALGSGVPEFVIGSSTATHFMVDGAGNVNIGTTAAVAKLNLASHTTAAGGINFGNSTANLYRSGNGILSTDGAFTTGGSATSGGGLTFGSVPAITATPVNSSLTLNGSWSTGAGANVIIKGNDNRRGSSGNNQELLLTNTAGGFMPTSGNAVYNILEVQSTINQTGTANGVSRGAYVNTTLTKAADYRALEVAPYTYNVAAASPLSTAYGSLFNAYTLATTSAGTLPGAQMITITGAPVAGTNITISSSSAFTIQGGAVNGSGSVTNAYGLFIDAPTGASNNYAAVFHTGNVGIGTSSPGYKITVQDNQSSSYVGRLDNANTGTDADGLLISLGVANADRTTGNYFIGFADGTQTVAGKIQGGASAVAYTTTAADLAEYFRASDLNNKPRFGEIVTLDKTKEKSVKVADKGSDLEEEPLGIVSTNPGFIGNGPICLATDENCDGDYAKTNVLVAIAGQVPVRFSEENGPIQVGDYLTLSSTIPGAATKLVGSGYIVGVAISEATSTTYYSQASDTASSTASTAMTVSAFIKSGWRDAPETSLATEGDATNIPSKWVSLFNFFKTVGFEVGQNFIKITNLITNKLTAEVVETKQLCIEDVCVNKDQLQALLISSGQNSATPLPLPTENENATTTPPVIEDENATTTSPIATTTDPVIEEDEDETATSTVTEISPETSHEIITEPEPEIVPEVIEPEITEEESAPEPETPTVTEPAPEAAETPEPIN